MTAAGSGPCREDAMALGVWKVKGTLLPAVGAVLSAVLAVGVSLPATAGATGPAGPGVPPAPGAVVGLARTPEQASSGCPAGTVVYHPVGSPAALAGSPESVVPRGFGPLAGDPLVRQALAEHVEWLPSLTCTQQPTSPVDHRLPPGSPSSAEPTGARGLARLQSGNWSGYQANVAGVRQVSAEWRLPTLATPPRADSSAVVSIWPGMGSGTSSRAQLAQAGSQELYLGNGTEFTIIMWYEVYPQEDEFNVNLSVKPGDLVGDVVAYDKGHHEVLFFIADLTSKQAVEVTQAVSGSVGTGSAEWVAERTAACSTANSCVFPPLADFAKVKVSDARALVGGEARSAESIASDRINMFSCGGRLLAETSPFTGPKKFTVTWKAFGTTDNPNC
jgi:hypothetical protein